MRLKLNDLKLIEEFLQTVRKDLINNMLITATRKCMDKLRVQYDCKDLCWDRKSGLHPVIE